MASFITRNGRVRALVRMAGHVECSTHDSMALAKAWAAKIESQSAELKSTGILKPKGLTVPDLIDRYVLEFAASKAWGRSKSADLLVLKKLFGTTMAGKLNTAQIIRVFRQRAAEGAGPVTVNGQVGYLCGVLRIARTLWRLDVPLQAALDARTALISVDLVGKSQERSRRPTAAEVAQILAHFDGWPSHTPYSTIVRFLLASGMRISEVCRLRWEDLNEADRTILVRDRKDPKKKVGNHMSVPLTDRAGYDAFEIVQAQPRDGKKIFPYSPASISTMFTRAVAKIGIIDLHMHDLRHESLSRMFESGLQIQQVAIISGHRSWEMLKRYTHIQARDLHRAPSPTIAVPLQPHA